MVKNSMIRVLIETEILDKLKKRAKEDNLSFSEFCRRKLVEPISLVQLEPLLKHFYEELKRSNKLKLGGKRMAKLKVDEEKDLANEEPESEEDEE